MNFSKTKQDGFNEGDVEIAAAIVRIFETGRAEGRPSAVAVLNDGAGISYGSDQFTHRGGSLLTLIETYLERGGSVSGAIFRSRLGVLRDHRSEAIGKLSDDSEFKDALRAAGRTQLMREAQAETARRLYMNPALEECRRLGFNLPLSLAVIHDSLTHGSFEKIRDRVDRDASRERRWIGRYVSIRDAWLRSIPRLRITAYRTQFFIQQIHAGNWSLETPMNVHGVRLENRSAAIVRESDPKTPPQPPMPPEGGSRQAPSQNSSDTGRGERTAAPAETYSAREALDAVETAVNEAADRVDQTERIVTAVLTRSRKARSIWAAVIGGLWQAIWGIAAFVAGLPNEVWLLAAIGTAAIAIFYLYRVGQARR